MAEERTIIINTDTTDAIKNVDNLKDSVKDLDKKADEVGKKGLTGLGKASNVARKGVKSLAGGFKILGGAIKAAGIGLLITAFLSLKEVLTENEKTAKFFKVAFEGVSIVMNDFINFIIDNSGAVVGFFKDIFENPLENIKSLGESIQDNIVERFVSFLEVLGFVGEAMKKFVTGDFKGALESVKEAGRELVDVATGIDDSLNKAVEFTDKAIDGMTEYGKKVVETASKNIQLAESAEIAAAQQTLLVEKYDRQAEKLRQLRDNDLVSIAERKKANDELLQVLADQEKAMLNEADAILASAQAQYAKNKSTENQVALIEAQSNKAGVLAQIEGFRSEQEANRVALLKEEKDLVNSITEADANRANAQKEFLNQQEEDEVKRLEREAERLQAERDTEAARLQEKIDGYAVGTQARVDAEIELKDRLQEIDNEIVTNKKDSDKAIAESEKQLTDERIAAQQKATDASKNALNTAADLLGKNTAAGKAAAIAATTIDTIQSGVSAYKGMVAAIPGPVGIAAGAVAAAGSLASGYASVKKILSVKTPGGGGGGSAPSGGATAPQAPAFNLVGQSGVNQVQDSLQEESTPLQAYVVGSQITSQQELDRNQQDSASIG